MSNFRKSVPKPANGSGAPRGKNPLLKVVYVNDIASFPASDVNGVKTEGNLLLKAGTAPIDFYATDEMQKTSHTLDGEADAEGFLKKQECSHPGDELEINEFLQNGIGEPFIILYPVDCDGLMYKILGTKCNPLYIKSAEFTDDKDGIKHVIGFEQRRRDRLVAKFYDGVIPTSNIATPAGFEIALENATGPVYQLAESDVAATVVELALSATSTDLYNKVVTLIGGGGTEPATIESGTAEVGKAQVLLKGGVDWIALKGAVINFRAIHTPGAPNTYYLVEVSRS